MSSVTVRFAEAADMAAVCEIVNHYIRTTAINFRTEPQAADEWVRDWTRYRERFPWLVASRYRHVLGVAYCVPWNVRGAYQWSVEVTTYVAHQAARQGIGRALYQSLLTMIEGQGYRAQIAVITLPNAASVGLHEAFGFRHAGSLSAVGYKFGRWHDVGVWQRRVGSPDVAPRPIAPVPGLHD